MKTVNRISNTDTLYLTVMSGRKKLACTSVCGVNSLAEIYRQVSMFAQGQKGIITLYLRNSTQGWVQQHTMVLNSKIKSNVSASSGKSVYPSLFADDLFES